MKRLDISQVDALFSNGCYPIEFLFFYREAFDTARMRRALQGLSSAFWPLFGEYRDGSIFFDGYREEDFFAEETVDRELDIPGMETQSLETCSRFRLPEIKKLFFMKMIRFRNGQALIPKMNHLAGDGYSYFYFLSWLAGMSQPSLVPLRSAFVKSFFKPRHCRTILREFSFRGGQLEPPPPTDTFRLECLTIPREDVQSVIRGMASSGDLRISTNDVLSALAVKKLVKKSGSSWRDKVGLTIPMDVRRSIGEFGRAFFGNGIMLHTLQIAKENLLSSPVKDIAAEIRRSIPAVTREVYVDYLTGLEKILSSGRLSEFRPFDPGIGCLVTNLSRLPVDRLNFGTGCPELILPLTVETNSAGILADRGDFIIRLVY